MLYRTPSTCQEQTELLPLRHEAQAPVNITTTTTITTVHEVHDADDNNNDLDEASATVNTPPVTFPSPTTATTDPRDLEAGIHKSNAPHDHLDGNEEKSMLKEDEEDAQEDDIDKVVAAVSRPKGGPSGETLSRASKQTSQPLGGNGGELATLGFTNRGDYWEHSAFGRSRIIAIIIASVAICCLLYCLVASTWVYSGIRESTY